MGSTGDHTFLNKSSWIYSLDQSAGQTARQTSPNLLTNFVVLWNVFLVLTCFGSCYSWLAYSFILQLCRNMETVTHPWPQAAEGNSVFVCSQLLHYFSLTATGHNVTLYFTSRSLPLHRQWLAADFRDSYALRRDRLCQNNNNRKSGLLCMCQHFKVLYNCQK